MSTILKLAIITSLVVVTTMAQSPPVSPAKWTAMVGTETVTDEQVRKAAEGEIEKIKMKKKQADLAFQHDESAIYQRTLETLIEGKIIESEARKRNISPEALLTTEVDSKVTDLTDEEVRAFWEANKDKMGMNVPPDKALAQSRAVLLHQRRSAVYQKYISKIRGEYNIETSVDPIRATIATEGFPAVGPVQAPVTIVEFADFECPFCSALFRTLKDVREHYGDNVRLVFRQFPLTKLHGHSEKAAEASLCAFEQNKFWEMHDAMFMSNNNLEVPALKRKALTLGLHADQFNACIDGGQYTSAVADDIQDGTRLGVTGTPTLFIDGLYFRGAQSAAEISKVVDEELRRNLHQK